MAYREYTPTNREHCGGITTDVVFGIATLIMGAISAGFLILPIIAQRAGI